MLSKVLGIFRVVPPLVRASTSPTAVFRRKLDASGLMAGFSPEALASSQASVKVFANNHYISKTPTTDRPSVERLLSKTAAESVEGDHEGYFQDGTPFPDNNQFFSQIKSGDPFVLSPEERLISGKKLVYSESWLARAGGYPRHIPIVNYDNPVRVGIFSQAGAQFEMPYLHYSLFGLDPCNNRIHHPLFTHLYKDLPVSFDDAKKFLGRYDSTNTLGRIRVGFPFLCRRTEGSFYSSMFKQSASIFLNKAYERHLMEDTALLLASVNESARLAGKPALLKATAVGMGFFAKVDCQYDIKHHLYPYFLLAYRDLLSTGAYPYIGKVEFPTFSPMFKEFYDGFFIEKTYGGAKVCQSSRDVLEFSEEEHEEYFVCVVNPTDTNAFAGNEWDYASVESSIGNNTSLRVDQVYLVNPQVLNPAAHISVDIDPQTFASEIKADEPDSQLPLPRM